VKISFIAAALAASLLAGVCAQTASAQGGLQRLRQRRAANQEAKVAPNARAMEGLPPKWVENMRTMSPDEQERFMQNNQRFKSLPPQRQQQIRDNLQKWNNLTPEQKQGALNAETALERMSPEQRQYVRNTLLPKWQALPQDRRQAINRHLATLRDMSPATQDAALNDPKFMQGLSPDEQSMLRDLNSLRNPDTTQ